MPVGGDVTQFFLGLMAFYRESLQAGRLPVWNDLWGYGFPGLAESQMGVFYPVHVVLYRWLNTETAYVVSLMFHTIWGGLGAYWAARRMSISRMGSALAAFSWTASGFFLIHLAHPWGYTTGCWMPWAWGLGWSMIAPGVAAKPAYPFLLALVLALQLLPGHFQLAFLTQCGLLLCDRLARRRAASPAAHSANRPRATRRPAQPARGGDGPARACVGVSAGGHSARADGAAGSTGQCATGIRIPIRLCVAAVSSRELRRTRVVPSFTAVATARLGPFSCHARGTSGLRRPGSRAPRVHGGGPRMAPRCERAASGVSRDLSRSCSVLALTFRGFGT